MARGPGWIGLVDMDWELFKEMLRRKGLKVTKQRLAVLEVMACHPDEHLTTEEIFDLVKGRDPDIGLATIYRTVQVLMGLHLIEKVTLDDGFVRYELGEAGPGTGHRHHHAICKRCGKVFSFKDDLLDTLEQALLDAIGFQVVDHEVKLFGYCKECRKENGGNIIHETSE